MEIITKRSGTVIRDLPSARLTLTNELLDLGVDIEREAQVIVILAEEHGKKRIIIEKA